MEMIHSVYKTLGIPSKYELKFLILHKPCLNYLFYLVYTLSSTILMGVTDTKNLGLCQIEKRCS